MRLVIIESQEQRFLFLIFIFLEIKVFNNPGVVLVYYFVVSRVKAICVLRCDYKEVIWMMMRFYNSRVEHIVTKKTMSFLSSVTTLLFFIVIELRRKTPMLASGMKAAFLYDTWIQLKYIVVMHSIKNLFFL